MFHASIVHSDNSTSSSIDATKDVRLLYPRGYRFVSVWISHGCLPVESTFAKYHLALLVYPFFEHAGDQNTPQGICCWMNSKTLLTLFLTSTQHFNSHQLLPKRNYHFSISTCAFLKIEFIPLFYTRKRILTTTSISLLIILITASALSLTASSSAFVASALTMMTSWSNLGR